MLFRRKKKPTHVVLHDSTTHHAVMGDPILISLDQMPKLAEKYVAAMETGESDEWCRCEWMIHPDDITVAADTCRVCGAKKNDNVHDTQHVLQHVFRGRRKRRMDDAPDCPVHTKEGFLLYFIQWAMDHAAD